jgi:DNA-binding response OmpR family regulator
MVSPSASPSYAARFLVIEDELLIALLLEETIREFGYRVSAVARTIPEARREFAKRNFDAVLLDINIDGRYNTEIADLLLRENIPCAFVTPRHEHIPVLPKPFSRAQLRALLVSLAASTTSHHQARQPA